METESRILFFGCRHRNPQEHQFIAGIAQTVFPAEISASRVKPFAASIVNNRVSKRRACTVDGHDLQQSLSLIRRNHIPNSTWIILRLVGHTVVSAVMDDLPVSAKRSDLSFYFLFIGGRELSRIQLVTKVTGHSNGCARINAGDSAVLMIWDGGYMAADNGDRDNQMKLHTECAIVRWRRYYR